MSDVKIVAFDSRGRISLARIAPGCQPGDIYIVETDGNTIILTPAEVVRKSK